MRIICEGDGTEGYKDGDGINAKFYFPIGIAIDKNGNLFVADTHNHRIRKLSSSVVVSTDAGKIFYFPRK